MSRGPNVRGMSVLMGHMALLRWNKCKWTREQMSGSWANIYAGGEMSVVKGVNVCASWANVRAAGVNVCASDAEIARMDIAGVDNDKENRMSG